MLGFSIIICAFNSTGRLRKTLEHISALDYPAELVEIILVDNNSTDGTSDAAGRIWKDLRNVFSLNIVYEDQQGLNYARRRGIYEAKYQFVVFCDDDNWLSPQYLKIANAILTQNKAIGVLGGQGIPVTDADQFPNWFYTYNGGYAVGVQGVKSGDISERGYVWGACAIARRDLLSNIFLAGNDLILSGRKAGALAAGDDCEMCKWFLLAGYKLWYEETMLFYHFIPKERLILEYLDKLMSGFKDSREVLAFYDEYMQRIVIRQSWYKKPLNWILFELKFFLDRRPNKIKVVRLAMNITKLLGH